jgi:hypothetical protein
MTFSATDRDWMVLLDSLARGNCVLLLGPDLPAPGAEPAGAKLITALSNHLAAILNDEERIEVAAPDDFPLVAQLFVDHKSRSELEVLVTDFYEEHKVSLKSNGGNDPLFESLAALPFPLVVSSRHDLTLQHFMSKAGRAPITLSYNFRGTQQVTIGAERTTARPLVYHLFGSVSDPASLALTQRDLLDLLQAIASGNPALPTDLRNHFRDKSFLFLGCRLHHYYLRILLHILGLNRSGQKSFALETANAESVWSYKVEYRTLKLLDDDTGSFVQELQARLRKRFRANGDPLSPVLPATVDRPKVFLSYMQEDEGVTKQLKESLERHDIESWRDKEGLRGGDRWANVIDDAIGKDADFFVVVLSQHLRDGVETYVHLEIERALQRRSRRGALKFIYPLQVDDDTRLDALDRAGIQSSRLRDFDADVSELAKDIRREYAKFQRR